MERLFVCAEELIVNFIDRAFVTTVFGRLQASQSIFKPELCTAHLDIEERDLAWKEFSVSPHYVYLANSSGIKVSVTRESQGVVRWMDQGASQAIILAKVPNRRFSGDIEVAIKQFVADKPIGANAFRNTRCPRHGTDKK